MAETTLKWKLKSKNFDEFKKELGEEALNILKIEDNHCKVCVLVSR